MKASTLAVVAAIATSLISSGLGDQRVSFQRLAGDLDRVRGLDPNQGQVEHDYCAFAELESGQITATACAEGAGAGAECVSCGPQLGLKGEPNGFSESGGLVICNSDREVGLCWADPPLYIFYCQNPTVDPDYPTCSAGLYNRPVSQPEH